MRQRHAVRADRFWMLEVAQREPPELGPDRGHELLVVEPHDVGLALVEQLRRAKAQRRAARDLRERAWIEEQQLLRQVAEEADLAAGRHLCRVAAGYAVEELDLGLPGVAIGIAVQARDTGKALEAVEAMAVEGDEEIE